MHSESIGRPQRIGFVATRIRGNDGVSLEIEKWSEILERMGHACFFIAGASDRPADCSQVIPEAHFTHPVIREINRQSFDRGERRNPTVTGEIHEMTWVIKEKLHSTINRFRLDVIIAENCLTIPMNIPLGLAVVEVIMETGIGCIAHHHDFVWERERFLVSAVDDFLLTAFPPALPQVQHVVINSQAARDFSRRTGLPCRMIPNVMDFDNPPAPPDDYSRHFRETIGVADDDYLVLQPTRVVPRKGIEHSIELVRLLEDLPCKLVITHASVDEGAEYAERVRRYAAMLGVKVIFAEPWVSDKRGTSPEGCKQYTAWDAYQQSDFVAYPSSYEGFGNAFLEAIYYKKPLLCNRYGIYRTDIEPCGFQVVLMDGFLTDNVVNEVRRVLLDEESRRQMVDHNYETAAQFFSYHRVEQELRAILAKPTVAAPRKDTSPSG